MAPILAVIVFLAVIVCCALLPIGLAVVGFLGLERKGKKAVISHEGIVARPKRRWYTILPGGKGR